MSSAVGDRLYHESGGNPSSSFSWPAPRPLASTLPLTGDGAAFSVPQAVRAAPATELSSLSANAADIDETDALDLVDELF